MAQLQPGGVRGDQPELLLIGEASRGILAQAGASVQCGRSPVQALSAFTFTDGDRGFMAREEMLMHLVLHAGYHRGEVGRILAQLPITPPRDTFAVYLRQAEPSRRLQGPIPA